MSKSQQAAVLKELVLPPNFYVYQEDSVKQPAQITMGKVDTEIICDGKYYSAKLIKFEKIPKTTAKQIPDSGCIYSLIMNNDFIVKSTDSHKVNLRSQPDTHADIIKRLDDNAIVEKLKTRALGTTVRSGCCCRRRRCPRGWPRCASRCRRPGRAS